VVQYKDRPRILGGGNMERIWDSEVAVMYPNQWIVMVNCEWGGNGDNKNYGEVYLVTPDRDEAYRVAIGIDANGDMGSTLVLEGVSDVRELGGLEAPCIR
jgi:hypothetical protein